MAKNVVTAVNLGRMSYPKALTLQQKFSQRIHESVATSKDQQQPQENVVLLVEHNPVYTVGIRHGEYSDQEGERLRSLGADFHRTNRGGLITFHGPGQLVVYPILYLKDFGMGMKSYVHSLESTIMKTCRYFGIETTTSLDTGVWIGNNKIAAIGVHGSKFVTTHGLALNCNTDLQWFHNIVACGLVGKGVTSISEILGWDVTISNVSEPFLDSFQEEFNCIVRSEAIQQKTDKIFT